MKLRLASRQLRLCERFRKFAAAEIVPHAERYDQDERMPAELIQKLARAGYLGAVIPKPWGGRGWDHVSCGALCEQIGGAYASLLSLFTVHAMVSWAIVRWGTASQREYWLPRLAKGEVTGAFALTEPEIGSDAKNIHARLTPTPDGYRLNGRKKWISCGQFADLFLVFAICEDAPAALLVERGTPGLKIEPISGLLGFRSAMLAELEFADCPVSKESLLGKAGFGFSHVAGTALDLGRYCMAWGAVGISQACLDASLCYTSARKQFGVFLKDHQLIQQMIANMIASTKAARGLCFSAGQLRDRNDPESIMETAAAKYFASTAAVKAALDAVQIHGANGCGRDYPVQRYLRDAKIMEIIEGSSQIQQVLIAKYGYRDLPVQNGVG